MKFLILFFVCGALGDVTLEEILPQIEPETLTDLPKEIMDGDPQFVQDEVTTMIDIETVQLGRQNEVEEEVGEVVEENETVTPHWTEQGCPKSHESYNKCGPRCVQTCSFQPRVNGRNTRAVCDSIFSGSCHPGESFSLTLFFP